MYMILSVFMAHVWIAFGGQKKGVGLYGVAGTNST